MLEVGTALKVTVHLNEDTSSGGGFLHEQILTYLQHRGVQGATVFRPYAGFGAHRQLHRQGGGPVVSEHMPILLVFVDELTVAERVLPGLLDMVTDGLVESHPVRVLKNVATPEKVIR